jgi:two-component system, cell cycle response regulator
MTKHKTRDDTNFPSTLALPLDVMRSEVDDVAPAPPPASKPRARAPLSTELTAKYSPGTPRAVAPASAAVPARKASNSRFAALEPLAPPDAPWRKTSNSKFAALHEAAPRTVARAPAPAPAAVPASVPTPEPAPVAILASTEVADAWRAATAASAAAAEASEVPALRLVVRGFSAVERSLLDGTVKLSQRRTPRLQLLADSEVAEADVVMVNALDARAMDWAQRQPALSGKAVIWVDAKNVPPGHTLAKRPVQWPVLPILLARALEYGPGTQAGGPPPAVVAAASSGADVQAPRDAAASRSVLVVDDSLAVRVHLRSQLEKRGYQVTEAENVEAAMMAVDDTAFACVLMDVLMPGQDGYEGCKQIKAKLHGASSVPVIMLTSKSSPFDRIRGKMAGCDAYLTKPVEAVQLQETLAQCIPQAAGDGASELASQNASRAASLTRPAPILNDVV